MTYMPATPHSPPLIHANVTVKVLNNTECPRCESSD